MALRITVEENVEAMVIKLEAALPVHGRPNLTGFGNRPGRPWPQDSYLSTFVKPLLPTPPGFGH